MTVFRASTRSHRVHMWARLHADWSGACVRQADRRGCARCGEEEEEGGGGAFD